MSGDGGGGDGDGDGAAEAAGMEDMGFDSVSQGQSTESSAAAANGGATGISLLDQVHNFMQNPVNFATLNAPGSQGVLSSPFGAPGAGIASQAVQAAASAAVNMGIAGDDGPASGSGSGDGDTDSGSGGAVDAGGELDGPPAAPTPVAPLPLPPVSVPASPPATAPVPEPVDLGLIPLPRIGREIDRPEDISETPEKASGRSVIDELDDLSRQRFLNRGGALGLRGTRGLTLARPQAFGVLRLGQ